LNLVKARGVAIRVHGISPQVNQDAPIVEFHDLEVVSGSQIERVRVLPTKMARNVSGESSTTLNVAACVGVKPAIATSARPAPRRIIFLMFWNNSVVGCFIIYSFIVLNARLERSKDSAPFCDQNDQALKKILDYSALKERTDGMGATLCFDKGIASPRLMRLDFPP
jgi:hypothetical protein